MPRAYTREPTHPDSVSEQTHDDCEWLNEEDGEENVLGDRTGWDWSGRPPRVAKDQRGNVHGQNDRWAENR
jgi:hypothetical protein